MPEQAPLTIDEILAQSEGSAQSTYDSSREDWVPPDGDYDIVGLKPRLLPFQDKRTQKAAHMVVLDHQIIAGDLEGRAFEFLFSSTNPVAMGSVKTLAAMLSGGRPPAQYKDAVKLVLDEFEGKNIRVTVMTATNKAGATFVNIKYRSLL